MQYAFDNNSPTSEPYMRHKWGNQTNIHIINKLQ